MSDKISGFTVVFESDVSQEYMVAKIDGTGSKIWINVDALLLTDFTAKEIVDIFYETGWLMSSSKKYESESDLPRCLTFEEYYESQNKKTKQT